MTPCPHCREEIEDGRMICPNCGAFILPTAQTVWPPPPGRLRPPLPPLTPEPLLTGRRKLDFLLGFLPTPAFLGLFCYGYATNTAWMLAMLVPFLVMLALGIYLPHRYPVFARGIRWGLVAIPLLALLFLLGAFAVCLITAGSRGL